MTAQKRRFKPVVRREPRVRRHVATGVVLFAAAVGVAQFFHPGMALGRPALLGGAREEPSLAVPSGNAFGRSGEVKLLFAMKGEHIAFP